MKSALLSLLILLLASPILAQQAGSVATAKAGGQIEESQDMSIRAVQGNWTKCQTDTTTLARANSAVDSLLPDSTRTDFVVGPTKILSLKKICWLPFKRATYS